MTIAATAAVPHRLRTGLGLLLLPVVVFYLVTFVWPSLNVLWLSITHDQHLTLSSYIAFFSDPFSRTVLLRTVRLALLITVAALVVAYPIALYLADPERRGRNIVTFVVLAPLLVSAVVRAYGWIIILGPNGLLSDLLLDWHMASAIALILLMVTAGVTLLYSWLTGRGGPVEAAR